MPNHVVTRLMEELNIRHQKALAGCKILLCGLAYKKNIDDMRESPALELFDILEKNGAEVDYYDPFIPVALHNHDFPQFEGRESIAWTPEALKEYDAAIIATDHSFVDYAVLVESIPLTIDSRNVTKELGAKLQSKIAKA